MPLILTALGAPIRAAGETPAGYKAADEKSSGSSRVAHPAGPENET